MNWTHQIDRFWAGELGVDAGALRTPGFHVRERLASEPRPRGVVVGTSAATILSLSHAHAAVFERAGLSVDEMARAARPYLTSLRSPSLDVRGPAYLGCWPKPAPVRATGSPLRELGPADATALATLRALAPHEWEEAGLATTSRLFGVFSGDDIAAVAGYESWDGELAHLQVFCHPRHRRRRLATDALTIAIAHALAAGLLPQYRARDGNVASRGLADRLGFLEYGWMASIYLATP